MTMMGNRNPFWGKHHSEESKRKISAATTGRKQRIEHTEKIRLANTGKHRTEESKQKNRLSHLGKRNSEEHNHNISLALTGKKLSEETKQKLRLAHWGKPRSEETKKKISLKKMGYHHTEETKRKQSLTHLGVKKTAEQKENIRLGHLGKKLSEETKRKISLKKIEQFKDENFVKKLFANMHKKPTRPEQKLNELLQNNFVNAFKYVGDYKFWIDGRNPDFINVSGKKLIIELFGDYWHKGETGTERIEHYAKYGYKTLIVWEHELKNENQLLQKINDWR